MKLTMLEKEVPMDEYYNGYVDVQKFLESCRQCPAYCMSWSCPFHDFDVDMFWKKYSKIHICLLKMDVEPVDPDDRIYKMFRENQKEISSRLYELEDETPGSYAMIPGPCEYCGEGNCSRRIGRVCRFPKFMRYSMVSMGADLVKTAKDYFGLDIEWASRPKFLVMCGGLLIK